MKNFQVIVYLFISLLTFLFITTSAEAVCDPIYGGGLTCTGNSLSIQKQVLNPVTNKFVNNLGISDPKYLTNENITFQITLSNNGNEVLQKIVVKDNLPNELSFVDGPGQFDKSTNTLTFEVDNLAPNHSQLFTLTAKNIYKSRLPQSPFCVSNHASALASSGSVTEDSSQFCLQSLRSTPATGPEALGLFLLFPITLAGLVVKRFV